MRTRKCHGQDSSRTPPEHIPAALPLDIFCWLNMCITQNIIILKTNFVIIAILKRYQVLTAGNVKTVGSLGCDNIFSFVVYSMFVYRYIGGSRGRVLWSHIISHFKHVSCSKWFMRQSCFTVQMSNTPCPHTFCKVRWWWQNFRKCIILGKLS